MIHVRPIDLRQPAFQATRSRPTLVIPAPRSAESLWARMVERWRYAPESQEDYDARQW